MEIFVGIGHDHFTDRFDYVLDVLKSEQPDLILAEYGFREYAIFSTEGARSKATRIEKGNAVVRFDLTDEKLPRIFLDDLCVFSEGVTSQTPYESRAAVAYALQNNIPVFFVDEPFLHGENFSRDAREQGIIGFNNNGQPSYRVVITDYNGPRTNTKNLRLRQRNLFVKAASQKLEELYQPKVVASVGGTLHYFLSDKDMRNPFLDKDYGPQFTLPVILDAKEKRIYDALERRVMEIPSP